MLRFEASKKQQALHGCSLRDAKRTKHPQFDPPIGPTDKVAVKVLAKTQRQTLGHFAFNSYQDIPCANQSSTFAASDLRQAIRRVTREHSQIGRHNFRVRQHNSLAQSGCISLPVLSSPSASSSSASSSSSMSVVQLSSMEPHQVLARRSRSVSNHSSAMNETIQSIQSLSMQLNRASNNMQIVESSHELSVLDLNEHQQQQQVEQQPKGKLGKLVGKRVSRIKELLLQNLGKSDKTQDEIFQLYEENFHKQQNQTLKLHKEFKNYINSLKGKSTLAGLHLGQASTTDRSSIDHLQVCMKPARV